jgi:hypothetical protein
LPSAYRPGVDSCRTATAVSGFLLLARDWDMATPPAPNSNKHPVIEPHILPHSVGWMGVDTSSWY